MSTALRAVAATAMVNRQLFGLVCCGSENGCNRLHDNCGLATASVLCEHEEFSMTITFAICLFVVVRCLFVGGGGASPPPLHMSHFTLSPRRYPHSTSPHPDLIRRWDGEGKERRGLKSDR